MRHKFLFASVAVAALVITACSDHTPISSILAEPNRFADVDIEVRGVVVDQSPDSAGNGGFYVLGQDDDAVTMGNTVRVRSNFLPGFGEEYTVLGRIVVDSGQNSGPLLIEISRATGPDWLMLIIVGGFLAVLAMTAMFAATLLGLRVSEKKLETSTTGDSLTGPDLGEALAEYRASWRPMESLENDAHVAPVETPRIALADSGPTRPDRQKTVPFNYLGAELEVVEGPDKGRKYPVAASPLFIGRAGDRKNHVILTDKTVSMAHATIVRDTNNLSFSLVNDSQTNQAWVDDRPVDESQLKDGSSIRLGSTVLVFHQRSQLGGSKRKRTRRVKEA